MIRCVAFDFDGTLVDSNRIKRQTFDDVVAGIDGGVDLMARVLRETPGDRHVVFAKFVELSGLGHNVEGYARSLTSEYTQRCEDAISACDEMPGAGALLQHLQTQGLAAAVISATPRDALLAILVKRGWASAFAYVLGAPTHKVANLEQLAVAAGLSRNEIVMVGDREEDRAGALTFGCHFVALHRPDNTFASQPSRVISHLTQLPAMLKLIEISERSFR